MGNQAQLSLLDDSHPELPPPQPRDEIVTIPIAQPTLSAADLVSDVSDTSPSAASAPNRAPMAPSSKRIVKPVPKDDERYLSVKEVADRYSVSVQTVWRHTKDSPDFPKPIKVLSGSTRWKLRDLVAYEAFRQEAV